MKSYIYYLVVSGIIFYLFFFLISIFGLIFFNIIEKKILKIEKRLNFCSRILLSFTIGLTIYISFSFILFIFKAFNFYFAYLPLILIDFTYLMTIIFKRFKFKDFKYQFNKFILTLKLKKKYIFCISLILIIVIGLQYNMLWFIITKSRGLISIDPYINLKNVYYIIDYGTYDSKGYNVNVVYPQGFVIYCAGNLIITKDLILIYFFLKFASFHILTLYLLNIFNVSLKIFKRMHIAFICSLIGLDYYLLIFYISDFLSSSIGILFLNISLIIIIEKEKRYLYFLIFFVPLIYLINPIISIFFNLLIILYFLFNAFLFKKENLFGIIKVSFFIFLFTFIVTLPYFIYILSLGKDVNYLIGYTKDTFVKQELSLKHLVNSNSYQLFRIIKYYFYYFFFNIIFITWLNFLFFSILGFLNFLKIKMSNYKNIQILSQIAIIIIFFSYLILLFYSYFYNMGNILDTFFLYNRKNISFYIILDSVILSFFVIIGMLLKKFRKNDKSKKIVFIFIILILFFSFSSIVIGYFNPHYFYISFQDRVIRIFSPLIVILCGYGIIYLENIFEKIALVFEKKYNLKLIFFKKNYYFSRFINFKSIILLILIPALININFKQTEIAINRSFIHYYMEENAVDAVLFIREHINKGANIMIPDFSDSDTKLIKYILYDMDIFEYNLTITITYIEFNIFIENNEIEYLFIKKTQLNYFCYGNLTVDYNFDLIYKNDEYEIYKFYNFYFNPI